MTKKRKAQKPDELKRPADRLKELFDNAGGKTVSRAKIQKILTDEYGLDAEEYGSDPDRNTEIARRRLGRHIEKLMRKKGR